MPEPAARTDERLRLRRSHAAARRAVGQVIDDSRFSDLVPVAAESLFKIRCCHAHWVEGLSWEETGIFDIMLRKTLAAGKDSSRRSLASLRLRYERLDRIYDRVARDGLLLPPRALGPAWARDGIEVHLGPGGEPIFGGCGTHRLAIARALGLPRIPVVLGFVHVTALTALAAYRDRLSRPPQPMIGGDEQAASRQALRTFLPGR